MVAMQSRIQSLTTPQTQLLVIVLSYIALCSVCLDTIPPNTDEAVYIIRGLNGGALSHLRESKILTLALYALSLPASHNAVFAARFLSVTAGAITIWLLGWFSLQQDPRSRALAPALFYALCPFSFFYTRVAMPEPFLTMCGAAVLVAA